MTRVSSELSKISKSIEAMLIDKQQAYKYLTKSGFRLSEMSVQPKDKMRVVDMNRKSQGNENKFLALSNQMSNAITNAEKAYRRGLAVLEYAELPIVAKQKAASYFFEKAISLG